jgi:hypothetical protein
LEVVNEGSSERVEFLLRMYVERAGPSPRFRRQAWRDFQRALDPLARPKELPQKFRR